MARFVRRRFFLILLPALLAGASIPFFLSPPGPVSVSRPLPAPLSGEVLMHIFNEAQKRYEDQSRPPLSPYNNYYYDWDMARHAWYHSHALEAYISLFEATGDAAWLDKLERCGEMLLEPLPDADRDGFGDAVTSGFQDALLPNDNFEEWHSGQPGHWQAEGKISPAKRDGENAPVELFDLAGAPTYKFGEFSVRLEEESSLSASFEAPEAPHGYAGSVYAEAEGGELLFLLSSEEGTAHQTSVSLDQGANFYRFQFPPLPAGRYIFQIKAGENTRAVLDLLRFAKLSHFKVHLAKTASPLLRGMALRRQLNGGVPGAFEIKYRSFFEHYFTEWEKDLRTTEEGKLVMIFSPSIYNATLAGNTLPYNMMNRAAYCYFYAGKLWDHPAWSETAARLFETWTGAVSLRKNTLQWSYMEKYLPSDTLPRWKRSEDTHHANGSLALAEMLAEETGAWKFSPETVIASLRALVYEKDGVWFLHSHLDGKERNLDRTTYFIPSWLRCLRYAGGADVRDITGPYGEVLTRFWDFDMQRFRYETRFMDLAAALLKAAAQPPPTERKGTKKT